jgi:hypothetical protein
MECSECGKRALSVATRCPHCGFQFPSRPLQRAGEAHSLGRHGTKAALAGAVLAAIVVAAILVRRSSVEAVAVSTDVPGTIAPVQSAPPRPSAAVDSLDSAPAATPSSQPSGGRSVRRYARTWVHVRGDRDRAAPSVRILNPGEGVQVDSLNRGWYRVLVNDRMIGYVHRSMLGDAPAE